VRRKGRSARRLETDLLTGRQALVVEEDSGDTENLSHGLVSGETLRERWEIAPHDPLSACVTMVWEQRLSRGDWSVRTEAQATMTGTADSLHMQATLIAWDGETELFRRDWDDLVPRRFV
jgi:uncharacterized protein